MSEQISGQRLFWRFAAPCANYNLTAGKITPTQFDNVMSYSIDDDDPDVDLLKDCFPVAFESLERFIRDKGIDRQQMWSYDTVLACWRLHKGRTTDCAVTETVVESVIDGLVQRVLLKNGKIAFNSYGIKVKADDTTLIHRNVVAAVI
ncbi:hypothetical protein KGQ27_01645 [Patescibacteria group bacterium]|nr:hypothetical protein [Patescibacteria group bacterium]MDE1946379.1 hypothetical protein [Patescibacteria group bacterium]MDE2010831.1 hypothetical protein [Patescibacteria group bacterium]MDE2233109.1 hypothetical protein [Patescibacteria group bacterium]